LFYFLHPLLPQVPLEQELEMPQNAREYHVEKLFE
jgi:hypothetical protein